jgi:hypothetical protein
MRIDHSRSIYDELRYQAMADAVDATLEAWGRELAANAEALREEKKRLEQHADEASLAQRQQAAQQAMDSALDARVESYLEALLTAASDPNSKIEIPDGYRTAGSLTGPGVPDLSALLSQIESVDAGDDATKKAEGVDETSRASAAWALGHGMMPHPADLSAIMKQNGVDLGVAAHFDSVAASLSKVDTQSFKHPQLKVQAGSDRLDTLKGYLDNLTSYGSGRLVKLVSDPASLLGTVEPAAASQTVGRSRGMPERQFNSMLDNLFSGKR